MKDEPTNFQAMLRQRQEAEFVGRRERLVDFRANLRRKASDSLRRFIFDIHGVAGVGKTYLAQQLRSIAIDEDFVCGSANEDYFDIIEMMTGVRSDLERQNVRLRNFSKRLLEYHRKRQKFENDPEAPVTDLMTTLTVKMGLSLTKSVPILGSASDLVDADSVADQVKRLQQYITQKFSKSADIDLLLSPVPVLTRAFVEDIKYISKDHGIALFFDTFEATSSYLEGWLIDLIGGRFGDLPINIVIVISGQNPLQSNRWSPLRSLISTYPLEPFSIAEAEDFLRKQGIEDVAAIAEIMTLSERIPIWLATLGDRFTKNPGNIYDPSDDAVDRFLRGEPEHLRKLAVLAAIPRQFNRDVLEVLCGSGDPVDEWFEWIIGLPFVQRVGAHWRYHHAARKPMIRRAKDRSPFQWHERHQALAEHFGTQRRLQESSDHIKQGAKWRAALTEETYHCLTSSPESILPDVLGMAVFIHDRGAADARRWASMISDAGDDSGTEILCTWGQRLQGLLEKEDHGLAYLDSLITSGRLEDNAMAWALHSRAQCNRHNSSNIGVESDLTRAIEISPGTAAFWISRGNFYLTVDARLEEALSDFNRALREDPGNSACHAGRGLALFGLDRLDDAVLAFEKVDANSHEGRIAPSFRGLIYLYSQQYDQVLSTLDGSNKSASIPITYFTVRASALLCVGEIEAAVEELNQALEINQRSLAARMLRGSAFAMMKRFREAISDFEMVNEEYFTTGVMLYLRGISYTGTGQTDKGAIDLRAASRLGYPIGNVFETARSLIQNPAVVLDQED